MRLSNVSLVAMIVLGLATPVRTARAECNCVAVAGDVAAGISAEVAKADGLFSRGDFAGALAIYASAYASSRDVNLMYAQGMAELGLGQRAKAKAWFETYLAASGTLLYKDRARVQLGLLGGASAAVRKTGGVIGGVGDVAGDVTGDVRGTGGAGVGATGAVIGGVKGNVEGKAKIGRKAGIVLGVIAVAALGAVLIHGIAAGVKDDIELDAKFDVGMGLAGVSVGISAIYVAGLTAATGAAAGAPCLGANSTNAKPFGLAAGFRF